MNALLQYLADRLGERSSIAGIIIAVEQLLHIDVTNLVDVNNNASAFIASLLLLLMKEHNPAASPSTTTAAGGAGSGSGSAG